MNMRPTVPIAESLPQLLLAARRCGIAVEFGFLSFTRRESRPCVKTPARAIRRCYPRSSEQRAVLVNTSFNVRGEPNVCTPEDAFRCFMGNELDVLEVGNCYLREEVQDPSLKQNYESAFELD